MFDFLKARRRVSQETPAGTETPDIHSDSAVRGARSLLLQGENDVSLSPFAFANTRYGPFCYLKNDNTIGKSIAEYGEWAQAEIDFLGRLVKPGMTVFDIGANIGTHSIAFSKLVGDDGKIVALEPQRLAFINLCCNCALTNSVNIYPLQAAAGASTAFLKEEPIDYTVDNNFGAVFFRNHEATERSYDAIPVVPLDSLQMDACDLIKIDAEGMEEPVITGALQVIEKFHPKIYFEAADWKWVENVEAIFSDVGYRLFLHVCPAFNPDSFRASSHNLFGNAVERNVLAVHSESLADLQPILSTLLPFTKENYLRTGPGKIN